MAKAKEYLVKAQVIKNIANKIIDFLAQIEDFQKKMYLKKKLVVSTNYCITLDRIPEKMYPEIIQNDEQRKEWVKLFAIDEIKADNIQSLFEQQKVGYTEPLTIEFLKQNPYLVLDTKFFSDDFKERLVESIDDLDENTNGLMIHGDNFQAIRFLKEKVKKKVDQIYIDPPYNAKSSEILYKNTYKHSSWLSFMQDRILNSDFLRSNEAPLVIAIDENELFNLTKMLNNIYGDNSSIDAITVVQNPRGIQGDNFSYTNEYCLFVYNAGQKIIGNRKVDESEIEYSQFRNWGSESERTDAKNCFYPVFVKNGQVIGCGTVPPDDYHPSQTIYDNKTDTYFVYPIDPSGIERKWRYATQSFDKIKSMLKAVESKGHIEIQIGKNFGSFKTVWDSKKYDASVNGTQLLTQMFNNTFTFPKSLYLVEDCISACKLPENPLILDYFAGSGTTGHAVIDLNREDGKQRKFILCEMGTYFNTVTKPRIEKAIYSHEWKCGKPIDRSGISSCIKYQSLESYEDSLNNIKFNNSLEQIPDGLKEEYLLKYMINMETKESMFNVDKFAHPFNYVMDITQKQETKKTVMDIVESFNYLIGLVVERSYAKKSYDATFTNGEYGVLEAQVSDGTAYTLKLIEGHSLSGDKILVIWRDMTDDIAKDNAVLDAVLAKKVITVDEFDRIYVNGDNNLNNTNGNKVFLIEDEMRKRMFED